MEYKYFAFISYNAKDTVWGRRLQHKLERYRMSSTLCSRHGWGRTPMKPVFFAPTDIQPGGLSEELKQRLESSRHLVVICSPHSARSEWVGREIAYFHGLGRTENIHFFIVEGEPHSGDPSTECFNPVTETLGMPELLGANIHERVFRSAYLNRERAYVQLISKMLGVEFDEIWQRHRRALVRKVAAWVLGTVGTGTALVTVGVRGLPMEVEVRLAEVEEAGATLPEARDAIVTLTLDNERKSDTVGRLSEGARFANVPRYYEDRPVGVEVRCEAFVPLDTVVPLRRVQTLALHRDAAVFGDVRFRVWDSERGRVVPYCRVLLEGEELWSDEEGWVKVGIPLAEQRRVYRIVLPDYEKECSLTMPITEDAVVVVND